MPVCMFALIKIAQYEIQNKTFDAVEVLAQMITSKYTLVQQKFCFCNVGCILMVLLAGCI